MRFALLPYYRRNITLFHCFSVFHSNCRVTEKKWNTNKNLSRESGRSVSEKYSNIILVIWFGFVIINAIILLMTQHFWTLKSMLLKGRYNYNKINYKKWNTQTHTHTRAHTHIWAKLTIFPREFLKIICSKNKLLLNFQRYD